MPIRDLGYQPYEGERLPPSHNTMVLLRHGLRRAWGSWLVKISVFLGWVPLLFAIGYIVFMRFVVAPNDPSGPTTGFEAGAVVSGLSVFQLLFVALISLGAGAGAIAEDLTYGAFQFYFAKPVTAPQYLAARVGAVAFWCFMITAVPAILLTLAVIGLTPEAERLARTGLLLPALLQPLIIAVVAASASVGLSSLSSSRALTMSAWAILCVVPWMLGAVVSAITDWPWLKLLSLPSLLWTVGDALFQVSPDSQLHWYHAAPVLGVIVVGGLSLAMNRLRRVEVFS